jgi:sporulation protein YlmC with PRC-barrel domain
VPGNAVSAVAQLLTPDVTDRMAEVAGLDRETAARVVSAGVPAVLSGLTAFLSKREGVQRLACTVVKQPAGPWNGLTGAAGSSAHVAEAGDNLLTSLLGGESVNALTSSISKFVGASESSTRTLLSLLAPAIVSALGQERRDAGVDAMGVADILKSQSDLVTAAMPAGLSSLLQSDGFYDRLAKSQTSAASGTASQGPSRTAAYWILPLLAIAGLAWYFLANWPAKSVVDERTDITFAALHMAGDTRDRVAYLRAVPGDSLSIGAFHGHDVYDRAGDKIGAVSDLVVDRDGRIVAAVIRVASVLGIGEKDVAVPFSVLQHTQHHNELRLSVDVAQHQFHTAPAFEPAHGGVRSDLLKDRSP